MSANCTPSPETMRRLPPYSTGSLGVPFDGGSLTAMVPRSDTFRWTFEKLIRRASLCAAIMTSCAQPVIGSQASIAPALQLGGVPGVHTPDWQVSAPLQTLASAHDVPFATAVRRQPAFGSQVSVVHGLLSAQLTGVPGWQTPAWQTSTPLQRLPSLHDAPSVTERVIAAGRRVAQVGGAVVVVVAVEH